MRQGKGEEMGKTMFWDKCPLQSMPEPAGKEGCREKKRSHILSLGEDYNQVQLRWKNSRNAWKNGRDAALSQQWTGDKGPRQPWDHREPQPVLGEAHHPRHLAEAWTQSKMLRQHIFVEWMETILDEEQSNSWFVFLHTSAYMTFLNLGRSLSLKSLWILFHLTRSVFVFSVHSWFQPLWGFPLLFS